jgi:hypothetical protein
VITEAADRAFAEEQRQELDETEDTAAGAAAAAAAAADLAAAPGSSGASSSSIQAAINGTTAPTPAAAAGVAESDVVALGCCDVRVLHGFENGSTGSMHIDGDLLSCSFHSESAHESCCGFGGSVLQSLQSSSSSGDAEHTGSAVLQADRASYAADGRAGFAVRVCADAGNALVWGAMGDLDIQPSGRCHGIKITTDLGFQVRLVIGLQVSDVHERARPQRPASL